MSASCDLQAAYDCYIDIIFNFMQLGKTAAELVAAELVRLSRHSADLLLAAGSVVFVPKGEIYLLKEPFLLLIIILTSISHFPTHTLHLLSASSDNSS